MKSLGIIGFGRFGKFMVMHLSDFFNIGVFDFKKPESMKNIKFTTLNDVCKKEIIIIAVPMENLENILNKIKNKLRPGTLIIDVCSLKVFSCNLMQKILPENVEIIGTHPLFGPQSATGKLNNLKIVLCNLRSTKFDLVKKFCLNLGLEVLELTPEEHDRQMALSQALTHFIGQVCKSIDLQRVDASTRTFDDLMNVMEVIRNDTKALFENMQTMNPYAKKIREKFVCECIKLENKLK